MKKVNQNSVFAFLENAETYNKVPRAVTDDALSIVIDAINSNLSGLIVTDLTGIIRFANPAFCRMFAYYSDDVIGKDAGELFSSKEIRGFSDVIAILDISRDFSQEFIVERTTGKSLIVEVSASDVTTFSGKIVGRMASFIDITERKTIENDRKQLIKKLQHALDTIKVLKGIIPICASCKKIRDDKGYWNILETYLKEHSEAIFSHGICPDCSEKLYSGYGHKNPGPIPSSQDE